MGNSRVKDPNIDLFIDTDKNYYVAGEYVEGVVYLNAKAGGQYSNLTLYIEGKEYVRWTTGSGKNRRTHSNRYQSYYSHHLMTEFRGGLQPGQFTFPFSMLLPAMMCGSFYAGSNCYISYTFKV